MLKRILILFIFTPALFAQSKLLINMDFNQTDHLKAYGITYNALGKGLKADWLLNYKGGSFLIDYTQQLADECRIEGVSFGFLDAVKTAEIY